MSKNCALQSLTVFYVNVIKTVTEKENEYALL